MKRKKKKKSSGKQAPAAPEYSVDEIISEFWSEYEETDFDFSEESGTEEDDSVPAAAAEQDSGDGSGYEGASVTDDLLQWLEGTEAWNPPAVQESGASGDTSAWDADAGADTSWSVHDILDEYRENELVDEIVAEEDRPAETDSVSTGSVPVSGEAAAAAEEEPSAVWESFPEISLVSGIGEIAEAARKKPEAEEPEEIEDLNFDLPYSIRDIMQEFRASGEAGGPAEDSVPAAEEQPAREETDGNKVGISTETAPEEALPVGETKDEEFDFSWGALLWGKKKEAEPVVEENAVPDPSATEDKSGSESAVPAGDAGTETPGPVITAGAFAHAESIENVTGGDEKLRGLLSLENQVTANMPPTFIWHCTGDESVPVENTLLLTAAMQRAGVPYECHLFSGGAHGISMCNQEVETPWPAVSKWIELCKTWLNSQFCFIP